MLVDAQPRWLAVGEKAHAIEACVPHVFDNLIGCARQHVAPVTAKFYRRGEKRWSLLDRWGELCHDGLPVHHRVLMPIARPLCIDSSQPNNPEMNARRVIRGRPNRTVN